MGYDSCFLLDQDILWDMENVYRTVTIRIAKKFSLFSKNMSEFCVFFVLDYMHHPKGTKIQWKNKR